MRSVSLAKMGLVVESVVAALFTPGVSFLIWRVLFATPRISMPQRVLIVMCLGCLLVSQWSAWMAAYVSWQYETKNRDTDDELGLGGYRASRRWRRLRRMTFVAFFALVFLTTALCTWWGGRFAACD